MKFSLSGLTANNEKIELAKPIWFELLINNFGVNIYFKFFFSKPIPQKVVQLEVQIDSKPAQIFTIEKIIYIKKNKHPAVFEVYACSPINLVCQNFVTPENFDSLSVNTMFEKFCKPFQIKSISPNLQNHIPSSFFTTLGMTYWDTITLFFKKNFNTTIFVDKNKQITTKFKSDNINALNTNDPFLTNFEAITDRTKLISNILVQFVDEHSNKFTELKHENKLAEELKINRTKFFKLPKQFSMLPKAGAKAIIDLQNAAHKIIKLKFAKIFKPVLFPGTTLQLVNSDGEKINVCVRSFYTALLKDGPVSKITLFYSDLIK